MRDLKTRANSVKTLLALASALGAVVAATLTAGVAAKGNTVYVALKAAGRVAIVKANQQEVEYVAVTAPSLHALPHVTARG